MASGHVNRTNRPNTWPHRPTLRREDIPCQPGAVHTWHTGVILAACLSDGFPPMTAEAKSPIFMSAFEKRQNVID